MFDYECDMCQCTTCLTEYIICDICKTNKPTLYKENYSNNYHICSDPKCLEYLKLLVC